MTDDDKPRFFAALTMLDGTFGRGLDEAGFEGFWRALHDLDIQELEAAADEWLRTGRRFPVPIDLRELTGASAKAAAQEAWDEVVRQASNSRAARHPDPVAEECVRQLGGWIALGQKTHEQLTVWTRKEFIALYEAGAPREEVQQRIEATGPIAEMVGGLASTKALPASTRARR